MNKFLGKLLQMLQPYGREVRLQRMCPFCGLITPRASSSCLECGKSLLPAPVERKAAYQK